MFEVMKLKSTGWLLNPGMHEFRWNAETRSSGMYFIQLSFENTSFSQKVHY